jgi:meiotically up-regulated gene 157 (Mug157) protein
VDNQTVFECKYEIDSLCGFLKLSRAYYGATKDASFMNDNCACASVPRTPFLVLHAAY